MEKRPTRPRPGERGMAVDVPVRVFARPRPREDEDAYPECLEAQVDRDEVWIRPQTKEQAKMCPTDQNFVFDGVLAENQTTQDQVYSRCAEKVVSTVLEGYNGTVMCYGQTGAGKTYTMSGKVGDISNLEAFHAMSEGPHRGVMQRAVEQVFRAKKQAAEGVEMTIRMSYIEIYNDIVHDLIQEDTNSTALRRSVSSGQDANRGAPKPQIRNGASCHVVTSRDHAMELLHLGLRRRQVASHNLNRDSSRSHAILTLYVTQRMPGRRQGAAPGAAGNGAPDSYAKRSERSREEAAASEGERVQSRIDLVDLAGSERLSKTQSSGVHQSEAQHINKSLSFLEQVILAIGDPNRDHIPYRTCKLTQFLRESLGGNSYTVFVANIRLESAFVNETVRTCRFAQRMQNVKNSPILNVMRQDKDISRYIQSLVDENNHLKQELALYDSLSQASKEYDPYTDEQREALLDQVLRYLRSDNWGNNDFAPLEFVSVRHIKEIILQCKAVFRKTGVPSIERPPPPLASADPGAGGRPGPPSPARGNGHGIADEEVHDTSCDGWVSSPMRGGAEDGGREPRSQGSGGGVLDAAKIEQYKEGEGKQLQEALEENRMLVKTKKKESVMLAKQMNEILKRIKAEDDKGLVQSLKAEYRELHQDRAMLLSEIDHCKNLAAEYQRKLVEGVTECFQ